MTERAAFIAMFSRAGVKFTEEDGDLLIYGNEGEHNPGYYGFHADFSFDSDGKLVSVGVWEGH